MHGSQEHKEEASAVLEPTPDERQRLGEGVSAAAWPVAQNPESATGLRSEAYHGMAEDRAD